MCFHHLLTWDLLTCHANGWKTEEDCELCMFPELRDKSNNLSVVDRLSIMTSARTGLLPLQICERCKHSRESIYLSENDFWILLALSWCQINPSFMTESRVRPQRSPLCLHFLAGPGYKACQEMACQKMSSMHATLIAGSNAFYSMHTLCMRSPLIVRTSLVFTTKKQHFQK